MKTLDRWRDTLFCNSGTTEFPTMRILAKDHEPPVFVGPGHVDITDHNRIEFRMFASAPDLNQAVESINRAQQNPYKTLDQFRLFGTDYEGQEWACGWISPTFKEDNGEHWLVNGTIRSLGARVVGNWVEPGQSVELLFQPSPELPLSQTLMTAVSIGDEELHRSWHAARHSVETCDTTITFFYERDLDALWVTAPTTTILPPAYAENWIAEPLRILLGQLLYPRLVARNLGDGSALVQLRAIPRPLRQTGWVALCPLVGRREASDFWKVYVELIEMIATARDSKGYPNFESHPITRFYEELVQATQGSRWVQSMTLASTAEGLARMLKAPKRRSAEFLKTDVTALRQVVEGWDGDDGLKRRVLGWFARLGEQSVQAQLTDLLSQNQIEITQVDAWSRVRNAVMHGSMTAPWSTEEDDARLMALAGLVHALTKLLLRDVP